MNTRFDACALKRWVRFGSAGGMTLLALAACATGSAGQRSGAAMPPHAEPPAPSVSVTPPAPTAAVAPAAQEPPPASAPPQTEEPAPSGVPPSPAPAPAAAAPGAPSSVAPANAAGGEKMLPPCVSVRRSRVKHHKPKQPPAPQTPAPTGPPPPPPADAVVDAQVGEVGASLSSILGQEVMSPKGENLGRIVDVLADAQGHVRVAIIDFGGFLGVGTRRIAVDWPLLRFDPDSHDKPLILSVDRQKLQSAPEYHSNKPRVLMPPAAPDAADAGQTKK
jgi:PRC-barrel domain protein